MLYYYEGFQFGCLGSLWLRSYQNKIPKGHKTDVGKNLLYLLLKNHCEPKDHFIAIQMVPIFDKGIAPNVLTMLSLPFITLRNEE